MGGFVPKTAKEAWANQWIFDTDADFAKKDGAVAAFFTDNADEATINKTYELLVELMDKLNVFFSDGRKHACGENVCAADFRVLAIASGLINNYHMKNPSLGEKLRSAFDKRVHLRRVVANGMELPGVANTAAKFETYI